MDAKPTHRTTEKFFRIKCNYCGEQYLTNEEYERQMDEEGEHYDEHRGSFTCPRCGTESLVPDWEYWNLPLMGTKPNSNSPNAWH